MGPVFYLVQCDGVRDPISAVLLGNWPHELQPWTCTVMGAWTQLCWSSPSTDREPLGPAGAAF